MKFFSSRRLISGFTGVVFLAGILCSPTAVYAGFDDPKELHNKTLTKKRPLPAGVDAENVEKGSSKAAALWLKRGDTLYEKKSYAEALGFYEKAADGGNEEAKEELLKVAGAYFDAEQYPEALGCYQKALKKDAKGAAEKFEKILGQLVIKGDAFYEKEQVVEAFVLYTQAATYGNKEAKELVAAFGVEAGDSHAAKGNPSEALKCYEQAALYGSGEAKKKLEELKQAEAEQQGQNQRAADEEKLRLAVPSVAKGYEAIYQRFLKGVLVYRPTEGSDVGKIELRIADLANPLEGTFDLSSCGDAWKYLSIATGYRKGKIAANASKVEIWITPRFLIEKNLQGNAKHFTDIMGSWDATKAPLGAFFTYGGWNGEEHLKYYDYATTQDFDAFSKEDFYGKWRTSEWRSLAAIHNEHHYGKNFTFVFDQIKIHQPSVRK